MMIWRCLIKVWTLYLRYEELDVGLIIFNFQFSSLYDNDGLTTFAKSLNIVFTIMFAKNLNIVFRFFETMGGWM